MSYAHLHLFDKNCVKTVILQFKITFSILIYLKILFIPIMQRWIFSNITPVCSNYSYMLICSSRNLVCVGTMIFFPKKYSKE